MSLCCSFGSVTFNSAPSSSLTTHKVVSSRHWVSPHPFVIGFSPFCPIGRSGCRSMALSLTPSSWIMGLPRAPLCRQYSPPSTPLPSSNSSMKPGTSAASIHMLTMAPSSAPMRPTGSLPSWSRRGFKTSSIGYHGLASNVTQTRRSSFPSHLVDLPTLLAAQSRNFGSTSPQVHSRSNGLNLSATLASSYTTDSTGHTTLPSWPTMHAPLSVLLGF